MARFENNMSLLPVTKLCEEFVVLYIAVSVEDEAVDCAVRYPRTHHAHHSSPSGTEYLLGDTNLHGVIIRIIKLHLFCCSLTRAGE